MADVVERERRTIFDVAFGVGGQDGAQERSPIHITIRRIMMAARPELKLAMRVAMVEWPSRSLALSAAASEGSFSGPVDDHSEGVVRSALVADCRG